MPVLTVAATLAAASMAGLPPLLGFLSKEAAFESLLNLFPTGDGTQVSPALSVVLLVTIVVGSALTMAYSLRFVWGAFADKPGVVTESRPVGRGLPFSPIVLGFACLVAGFTGPTLTGVLTPYALTADGADGHGLALWHGFSPPLAMSALAIAGGILLFWQRDATSRLQETFPTFVPADEWYKRSMKALDVLGVEVTSRFQQGAPSVCTCRRSSASWSWWSAGRCSSPRVGLTGSTSTTPRAGPDRCCDGDGRGARRDVPGARPGYWCSSASPDTARPCCSCCTGHPIWRSPRPSSRP